MKKTRILAVAATFAMVSYVARADVWVTGTITELRSVYFNNPAVDGIAVVGTFNTGMGCTNGGFMLYSADLYFKESYALLLAAKTAGKPIKFSFSFCQTNGWGRGNAYSMID